MSAQPARIPYNLGMRRRFWGVAGLLGLLSACAPETPRPRSAAIQALSQPAPAGFARADKPRRFVFPADDGPHPNFQTEWWYYTGNLAAAERHFGYELTIFRRALAPGADASTDWPTRQIYFAHLTLTDVSGGRFFPFEKFGRQSIGLAGAQARPFRVWIDNWEVAGTSAEDATLTAAAGDVRLKLRLQSRKAPVLQGEAGWSRKSAASASYYYSRTRLRTTGEVQIGPARYAVSGLSWMDREWSTSALSADQSGWDWFSLQLKDGRELMLYQLRLKDGGVDSFSAGTLIAADGSSRHLRSGDFRITPLGQWRSGATGVRYPSGWRVAVPAAGLQLELQPWLANQELPGQLRYWEGAVRITGSASGDGYVELTGYE